jgi:predicted MPP superfamily phosphohydrolase
MLAQPLAWSRVYQGRDRNCSIPTGRYDTPMRATPDRRDVRPGRQRFRRGLLLVTLLCLLCAAVTIEIGMANAVSIPIIRRAVIHAPGLPSRTRPIKIALLSDVHIGNRGMTPERLSAVVDQVNGSRPDLAMLAGDFISGHDAQGAAEHVAAIIAPLKRLTAPLGVVAVLGNHDNWTDPAAVRAALAAANVTVIENQVVRRGPLKLIGVGDRFSHHDDARASLTAARHVAGIPIVLTHSPDIVPDLPANQPLILAGHTHCGQVVLPWLGPFVTHAPGDHWRRLYNPRYRCGLVRDGARITIVTAGVGSGTSPIRLGAMPDWWLITIEP